jgi:hypothetical protein
MTRSFSTAMGNATSPPPETLDGARGLLPLEAASRLGFGLRDIHDHPGWLHNLADTCFADAEAVGLLAVPAPEGGPVSALPVARRRLPGRGRELVGLANVYTCRYSAPDSMRDTSEEVRLGAVLRRMCTASGRLDRVRFEALSERGARALSHALARAGFRVETFPQFGTWYQATAGLDFDAYWAARPGRLRSTVARRRKALVRDHDIAIRRYADPQEAAKAAAAYDHVYARAWQTPEPFPAFAPGLIRRGLQNGFVEVWTMTADGVPIAAQIWLTGRGRATIFKLAYDAAWKRHSPGTVLTHAALEATWRRGDVREIDFGRGDDAYKADWLPERRQMWGVAAYNPRRPVGFALALRNLAPRAARRLMGRGGGAD